MKVGEIYRPITFILLIKREMVLIKMSQRGDRDFSTFYPFLSGDHVLVLGHLEYFQ